MISRESRAVQWPGRNNRSSSTTTVPSSMGTRARWSLNILLLNHTLPWAFGPTLICIPEYGKNNMRGWEDKWNCARRICDSCYEALGFILLEAPAFVCPDHYKIKFPCNSVTACCQGQGCWSAGGSSGSGTVSAQWQPVPTSGGLRPGDMVTTSTPDMPRLEVDM